MTGKNILYASAALTMALVLLLAGCGGTSTSEIERGYNDPGWWGTDGATVDLPNIENTGSASITTSEGAYSGSSTTKKSLIYAYVINGVYYIAITYCDDVTSSTSFAFKMYFAVSSIPEKLGNLNSSAAINLMDGTHSPVVKIRKAGDTAYTGGALTAANGSLELTFTPGADQVTTGDQMTVNIASTNVNCTVGTMQLTALTFTNLIRVPYTH